MHLPTLLSASLLLGSVFALPAPEPIEALNVPVDDLVASKRGAAEYRPLALAERHADASSTTDVGDPAPRDVQIFEKRQGWRLNGRIMRIIATITAAPGQILNHIGLVFFAGPGVVEERTPNVDVTRTQIDEGQQDFEFEFTVVQDDFRYFGEINVDFNNGDINYIFREGIVERRNAQGVWQAANNAVQLGCGWQN